MLIELQAKKTKWSDHSRQVLIKGIQKQNDSNAKERITLKF